MNTSHCNHDARNDSSRRDFLRAGLASLATGAATAGGLINAASVARAHVAAGIGGAATSSSPPLAAETLASAFFKTLSDEQRKILCFPFDHPLRSKVDNNWMIVDQSIGKLLNPDQQEMVKQIFLDMHSEAYAARVLQQVEHDNVEDGGLKGCAVAFFGEPGKNQFEFVLTGRHVTRRCDGNSVEGAAFGGPIFYGHAAEGFRESARHPGNIYWYQAERANRLFQALDAKHRSIALRDDPRQERGTATVSLPGKREELTGLPVSELSKDQQELMQTVMHDLLAPFRKSDADEAMKLVNDGGFEKLHITFYKNLDIGNDGVWDLWQVEGPSMLWYFRGAPHVHAWVNVRDPRAT